MLMRWARTSCAWRRAWLLLRRAARACASSWLRWGGGDGLLGKWCMEHVGFSVLWGAAVVGVSGCCFACGKAEAARQPAFCCCHRHQLRLLWMLLLCMYITAAASVAWSAAAVCRPRLLLRLPRVTAAS